MAKPKTDWTKVEHYSGRRRSGWMIPFLRELMLTGDVRLAAEAAGVEPDLVVEHRNRDPEFAEFCVEAFRIRLDWLALQQWQQHCERGRGR